jgi:hypothetical protein
VDDLLRLCARLGADPLPPVYAVADGFLIKLDRPSAAAVGGVIRLRALADNLLVPATADLVPPLLPDEAAALVRQRGLVILPGGRVLEFAPDRPLPLARLLTAGALRRRAWQSLPAGPRLAGRLTEITLDRPDPTPDDLLRPGGESIGTEAPRPADSGLAGKALGKAALGTGKGLAWLGRALHLGWLARAGAKMMAAGLAAAPRLTEALLGRQEAALRELLRRFRAGDVENALRHALPLREDRPRGPAVAGDCLPAHNLLYSLSTILGRGGSGPASYWMSSEELYRELNREYRKQAELATRRGDHRRAAFIYAMLLGDYRLAAGVLAQGGLHHDAALLYLNKAGDALAAAREFEAAGEIDRALKLYRQRGEHALAGDLFRRMGEEELALVEYRVVAAGLAEFGQHYEAGELLRTRAERPDLALAYYEAGWAHQPRRNPVPCAVRMAQIYAPDGAGDKLLRLVGEADEFLGTSGQESGAAEFYNEVARLADQPPLARIRDDLRDRALVGLAGQLRQRARLETRPAHLASVLFARPGVWPAAVLSDAEIALKLAARPPRPQPRTAPTSTSLAVAAQIAVVRAVCWAPVGEHFFLGFESGEMYCYRPRWGEIVVLPGERTRRIVALAASEGGGVVVAVRQTQSDQAILTSLVRTGTGYREHDSRSAAISGAPWLCPALPGGLGPLLGFWDGDELQILEAPRLLPLDRLDFSFLDQAPETVLLLPSFQWHTPDLAALVFADGAVWCFQAGRRRGRCALRWASPRVSALRNPWLSWLRRGPDRLEVASVRGGGVLGWAELEFTDGELTDAVARTAEDDQPYLAAAVVRAGQVAALTPRAIHWLRAGPRGLQVQAVQDVALSRALACFPFYRGKELLVVSADGTLTKIPFPG